jgi:ABC-type glycerol-3-phosphate transport system substrate-binding protein
MFSSAWCYNADMPGSRDRISYLFACLFALLISACNTNAIDATPEIIPSSTPSSTAVSTPRIQDSQSGMVLSIWLPPWQSPYVDTPAARLLSERLLAFESAHPTIKIRVRVKDESGLSGLFETLKATHAAAPSALPDIISLDPMALQQSASFNLLSPLDGIFDPASTTDWYDHAEISSTVENEFVGMPFVSDTELFVYRKETIPDAPTSWSDLLSGPGTYIFPAGDKEARFTLAQYIDQGGELDSEDTIQNFDVDLLNEILNFYSASREAGYLPLSALQLQNTEETWSVLSQEGSDSAVIPLHSFLHQASKNIYAALPLPTRDGSGIVFVETFSWSIVTSNSDRQIASAELIEWLLEADFLGPWAYALGMLPTTSSALAEWPDEATAPLVNRLIRSSEPLPGFDAVEFIGPMIQTAIEDVIYGRKNAQEAAEDLLESLTNP